MGPDTTRFTDSGTSGVFTGFPGGITTKTGGGATFGSTTNDHFGTRLTNDPFITTKSPPFNTDNSNPFTFPGSLFTVPQTGSVSTFPGSAFTDPRFTFTSGPVSSYSTSDFFSRISTGLTDIGGGIFTNAVTRKPDVSGNPPISTQPSPSPTFGFPTQPGGSTQPNHPGLTFKQSSTNAFGSSTSLTTSGGLQPGVTTPRTPTLVVVYPGSPNITG